MGLAIILLSISLNAQRGGWVFLGRDEQMTGLIMILYW